MTMPQSNSLPLEPRAAGVLLHITSLPSHWGVGDIGPTARQFAARLGAAGLRYWQVLPLNPTTASAGDSPYYSSSARAANALLISLEDLVDAGLLTVAEVSAAPGVSATRADFGAARARKIPLLALAAERAAAVHSDSADFVAFCAKEADWLDDHALFTAIKEDFGTVWAHWPEGLKRRDVDDLRAVAERLATAMTQEKWLQFLFQRQWQRLHAHCAAHDVWLFGDMPIYVNLDSVDVWASPAAFKLDEELRPSAESGVPPDYFSETGQLWRNPVYDWEHLQRDDFCWWQRRLTTLLRRLDVLRIDHFRGLVQYWEVAPGAHTAIDGHWRDVPSDAFFTAMQAAFDPLPVVAEDLGTITPDVIQVRERYGFPGMIVLQFAFGDDHSDNPYIPDNHAENAVAYLGTHDNNTTRSWYEEELDEAAQARLARYVEPGPGELVVERMIDLLLSSRARTAIVCAQDLLALDGSARMNRPGLESGNWDWQLSSAQFESLPLDCLADRCRAYGR
ncbi:MAG: 4-alpha-glucanotransferase [Halieaceae bacterium]|jgi:4-alpha-glucanotransferase